MTSPPSATSQVPASIVLTRPLYGDELIVERKVHYSQSYENRVEKTGDHWHRDASYRVTWWWKTRAPSSHIGDLHFLGGAEPRPLHIGWADPVTRAAESLTSPGDTLDEETLVRVARYFHVWQGKPSVVAQIGTPLAIHEEMTSVLSRIASSVEFGYDVPWGKGHLAVVPRSLEDDILRCDVTASVDHEHLERPAHHELKGTLDLWTPTGWPKRFVADGKWRSHLFVLAGRTVIDGTFHVEFHWSYGTDVSPVAPHPPKP